MNMNKALQNLYHAVSNQTTTKVNISKLLVDIHYAITGKESPVKNNWSRIIDSMATNWPEGGGGSSDFSTAAITYNNSAGAQFMLSHIMPEGDGSFPAIDGESWTVQAILYKGKAMGLILGGTVTIEGSASYSAPILTVTGDCTITIS